MSGGNSTEALLRLASDYTDDEGFVAKAMPSPLMTELRSRKLAWCLQSTDPTPGFKARWVVFLTGELRDKYTKQILKQRKQWASKKKLVSR